MATVTAKFCIPRASRWVLTQILTCADELAIIFKKHGVCCLYPGTTRIDFDIMLAFPSPGKYVHRFLYKKRPYRLIASPCPPVGCITCAYCPGVSFPATLYCTVPGSFDCPTQFTLIWNGSAWAHSGPVGGCVNGIALTCSVLGWNLNFGGVDCTTGVTSCSPLLLNFSGLSGICNCGSTAVVTP